MTFRIFSVRFFERSTRIFMRFGIVPNALVRLSVSSVVFGIRPHFYECFAQVLMYLWLFIVRSFCRIARLFMFNRISITLLEILTSFFLNACFVDCDFDGGCLTLTLFACEFVTWCAFATPRSIAPNVSVIFDIGIERV